jgi:hypothetical protein
MLVARVVPGQVNNLNVCVCVCMILRAKGILTSVDGGMARDIVEGVHGSSFSSCAWMRVWRCGTGFCSGCACLLRQLSLIDG